MNLQPKGATLHTYLVTLCPKDGTRDGNIRTEVRADGDFWARVVAEARFPGYRIEAVSRQDH